MSTLSRALDACQRAGIEPVDALRMDRAAQSRAGMNFGRATMRALREHLGPVVVAIAPDRVRVGQQPESRSVVSPTEGGSRPLIISRHPGVVAWLALRGIAGEVVSHATPEMVAGREVVGVVPWHLAALAASVSVIDLPGLTPEQRGRDLTTAEMDAAGAVLRRYRVEALLSRHVICPRCGEYDIPSGTRAQAEETLRASGWTLIARRWYCRKCTVAVGA